MNLINTEEKNENGKRYRYQYFQDGNKTKVIVHEWCNCCNCWKYFIKEYYQ